MGKRRVKRECVFCGKLAYLTSDHVPPKGLFPSGTPLITVPSCLTCNSAASDDDEYLRAATALRMEVENNPVVNELLPKIMRGVLRSGARGNTGSIILTIQEASLFSPTGIFAGMGGTYVPDDEALSRSAARIVRGLYFHELGRRLPDSQGIAVRLMHNIDTSAPGALENVRKLASMPLSGRTRVVHRDVFTYAFNVFHQESVEASVWLLTFFGHTPILASAFDRAQAPSRWPPGLDGTGA